MPHYKCTLIVTAAALMSISAPANAEDTVVEIDNGLYAYSSGVTVNGQNMLQKDYEYCLTDKHTKKTLSDLINEVNGDGECDVTNVQVGGGRGSADISCYVEELGARSTGKAEADYSRTHFNVKTSGTVNGVVDLRSSVKARRISDCPPGWTPPPGISDE